MIKAKKYLPWIWLMIFSFPVFAFHYNFKTYSLEEGLAQSQVYCVIQDSRGFLWCGTSGGGVCRFDGKSFETFSEKDGLSNNIVYSMLEDSKGNLWFGTDEGITKYDRQTFSRYTAENGTISESILAILEDRQGDLWFGAYNGGVGKFNGKTFENYTMQDGLPGNRVYSIMQDRTGNLWIGTAAGAAKFDVKNRKFINYTGKEGLPGNKISCILQDRSGDIWFAAAGGAYKYNGRTFTQFTTEDGLCDNQVEVIFQDQKGRCWFGTRMGVSEYDGSAFTNYKTENGLTHNKVDAICQDREGNLWFGTGGGLCRLGGKMFSSLTTKDGLKSDMVWAFRQDKKGVIWISTDAGISRYYGENFPITTSMDGIIREAAYPFVEDRKGNIWFGSSEYIMRYNGRTFNNLTVEMGLSKHLVLDIFEDSAANIWIGTQDGGVKKFDGSRSREFTTADGLVHNLVNMIKEDKQGNIVFATDGGVSIYDGKTFKNITVEDGLPSRYITSLLIDARNDYWIGTYGRGLAKYTPAAGNKTGKFDIFTIKEGLNDNVVLSMIFDDSGNLLIGTNKGMNKLDAANFERTKEKKIESYDKYDGFAGIECNQNAVFKDKDGNVWFGTVKGAVRYNPNEAETAEKETATHITALKLFFETSDLSTYAQGFDESGLPLNLKLPHTKNHITFDFIGINLKAPEKVKYRVMLDGFEKNWTPVSKATSATYSNLPPGDFTFKVKACNNRGVWNKYPAEFHFRIAAPFWQQWWFLLLGFACASGCVYLFIKIRTYSLENRQRLLEEKINERTLELQQEKAKVEKINLELEQRVQERTEILTRVNKRLLQAQKMEAIGRLASGVAHDLNNVLAGVVTLPEILAQKVPDEDPLKEYLLMIQTSGEKAAAIVQDLLTLARRGIATFVNMNLNEVIAEYLNSLEYAKLKKSHPRVTVKTDFDKHVYQMLGSPIHLTKTIMNLVANAAEAMPSGGKITIITGNRRLDKPVYGYDQVAPGDYVVLAIADEGVGISPDDLEKIFEPFYTKKHMGRSGTGLGMAVVWGVVQDHNGYIEIQSMEGKGTTINLFFPKTTRDIEFEECPAEKKEYVSRGEAILVVDDEPEQREIASLALSDLGYRVAAVASGEEAIRYLEEHKVDLLILDMIMEPGIDGCETFKKIIKLYPGQKAIIVSGFSEDERVKTAQKMGAGAFIKKPYLRDEIFTAVRTELDRFPDNSSRT